MLNFVNIDPVIRTGSTGSHGYTGNKSKVWDSDIILTRTINIRFGATTAVTNCKFGVCNMQLDVQLKSPSSYTVHNYFLSPSGGLGCKVLLDYAFTCSCDKQLNFKL